MVYWYSMSEIRTWISGSIHVSLWDVIDRPFLSYNGSLANLSEVKVILSHGFVWMHLPIHPRFNYANPYMVLSLFATRFAAYVRGIRVSFIQPRLFLSDIKCSA